MKFDTLDDAIESSNPKTIFVISSPPKNHFSQIKKILDAKRNIFVEKPIFVKSSEATIIQNIITSNKLFVVELLMYKYTLLYREFIKIWKIKKKFCSKIECYFNIPDIEPGTFRDNKDVFSSPFFDIGSYIFTLLVDLGFSLDNLNFIRTREKNKKIVQFYISGFSKEIELYLEFGIGKKYKNCVILNVKGERIKFEKFFYGRKDVKSILSKDETVYKKIFIKDINGFEKMFSMSSEFWFKKQCKRFSNIIEVNNKFDSLVKDLIN